MCTYCRQKQSFNNNIKCKKYVLLSALHYIKFRKSNVPIYYTKYLKGLIKQLNYQQFMKNITSRQQKFPHTLQNYLLSFLIR